MIEPLCIQLAMPGDRIRLLALDGGGVRGLSSLIILKDSPDAPCKAYRLSSADAMLIRQLRLRDEQTDHRQYLPDQLPISLR
jgi:hypothetical protein